MFWGSEGFLPLPMTYGEREIGLLFHRDVRAGLLPVDWGDVVDDEGGDFGERSWVL